MKLFAIRSRPRRRHQVLAVVVGALLVLGIATVPSLADPVSGEDVATTATEQLTIGSFNTLKGTAQMRKFADVIGWQEVNDKPDWAKLNRSMTGYRTFWPKSVAAKAVPISWKDARFSLVAKKSIKTHGGEKGVTPARYVNWVLLKDRKTGERFVFVNTHFISGAYSGHPERRERWRNHATVLRQTVRDIESTYRGVPVFVVGDFNRKSDVDMRDMVRLKDSGSAAHPGYDQVYVRRGVTHGKSWVKPKWGSDHNARKAFVSW